MINTISTNVKCDVKNCKNNAEFYFETKGRGGRTFLCDECLQKLLSETRLRCVPKSPQNSIKRKLEQKAKEVNRG